MTEATAEAVAALAGSSALDTMDLTGGAPELNPSFRYLVERARESELSVLVRCNLTVLFEDGMEWLPEFYKDNQAELVCSLPCYSADNVDRQRGVGVFDKSIEALLRLNAIGYGDPGSGLTLNLVYNPVGAELPPRQAELEGSYKEELRNLFGIEFDRLLTITNMPIRRFADQLHRTGAYERYMGLLVNHFNPDTIEGLMCRDLVSVGWDGKLYDCDFNQMLEIPLRDGRGRALSVCDVERLSDLSGLAVTAASHCFGCTAGTGSSCGGALS